jgi:capsular exopolysaccharide synthesis family protein
MATTYQLPEGNVEQRSTDALTVQDMIGFLRRRRSIILLTAGILFALCLLWCIFGTKQYQASGQIQIQKENSDAFGLEGALSGAADSASDSLDYNVTLETQAAILESDTLALQVAHELDLEHTPDFAKQHHLLPAKWKPWSMKAEPQDISLEDAPVRRYQLIKNFSDRLKVEPVSGTRLIKISYTSSDPRLAAQVVNSLIRDFQEYTFQTRYLVTAQASGWLSGQITDLKKETEELQTRAIKLQRETGMFGDSPDHNIILATLEQLNTGVSAAEGNRILKEAIYHKVQMGDPELVSNLAGNMMSSASAPAAGANSLSLVQSLRLQEASIESEMGDDETRFGPAYPKIAELRGQLKGVDTALHAELGRVSSRARTDYEIAVESEKKARESFEAQKKIALMTNDKAIQFALAKQEADDSRDLYEDMLKKLKEAGVLEGLRSTNITIVDKGRIPARPSKPYAPVYLPASVGAGLFLGLMLALFVDLTDNRIHAIEELENVSHKPVIAVLPWYTLATTSKSTRMAALSLRRNGHSALLAPSAADEPNSFYMEAVRALRTSLMLSRSTVPPQVLKISSPLAGEGKSTLVMNLGIILAQQGSRVLLVDADLRRPQLHTLAGVSKEKGLSSLLSSTQESDTAIQPISKVPGLNLLASGPVPPFPAELLGSPRMKYLVEQWRRQFDFILIDSPPLLPVTDSMVLNQFTDFHLLVVRYASTPKAAFRRSYNAVSQQAEPGTVGVVVNAFRQNSQEYEHYYGYSGYSYNSIPTRTKLHDFTE